MAGYVTKEGDVVDLICWRHYGATRSVTELVLEANKHLKDLPDVLPAGISLTLPDVLPEQPRKVIRLWD